MSPQNAPFIVFSLPRSRSAWLSVFLSHGVGLVGHDIGVECATPDDFADMLRGPLVGTCETGAQFAWKLIRKMLPDAKFVVIKRDPLEVSESLARFGLTDVDAEMDRRCALLSEISDSEGTLTFSYDDLGHPGVCWAIYEHCTGLPMDMRWWAQMDALNVQVDMPRMIDRLIHNRDRIAGLKAEVARRLANA